MTTSPSGAFPAPKLPAGDARSLSLVPRGPRPELSTPRTNTFPFDLLLVMTLGGALAAAYLLDASLTGRLLSMLGIAVASGAAYSALRNPSRFPLWLVACMPYNSYFPFTVMDVSFLNLTNFLLGLGLVALLSSRHRRSQRLPWSFFDLIVLAFVGLGVLGMIHSLSLPGDQFTIASSFKRWLTPFYLYFLVRTLVASRRDVRDVVAALLWTTVLVGILVWFDGSQAGDRGSIDDSRVGSVLGQANTMGAFLVYYGAALFAFSLKAKSWGTRGACLAGFLVAVRGLLFTFSRGAYLALGSACGLLLLLANPAAFVVAGAVAVGAKYAPEIIPSSIQARLADTGETNQIYDDRLEAKLDRSSQHRLMLWRAGMAMVADHPLQGVGWHRFSETVGQYTEVQLAKDDPDDAHNAYILVGAELGIPALALMIVVLAWIIATSLLLYFRKTEPLDRALALSVLGSAVGVVVSCLFGSRFADETLISNFWTLVALLMASRHMRSDGSLFGAQP